MKTSHGVDLKFFRLWQGIGYFGIALVIFLSLLPTPPDFDTDFDWTDKVNHAAAYFTLVLWFVQLHPSKRWIQIAVGFFLLGVFLEGCQSLLPNRFWDIGDMVANGAGIVIAWILGWVGLNRILQTFERLVLGHTSR